jgi:hypothetical protein
MKTKQKNQHSLFLVRKQSHYKLYHKGIIANQYQSYKREHMFCVGKIWYNPLKECHEYTPSIWVIPIMDTQFIDELQNIMESLDAQ